MRHTRELILILFLSIFSTASVDAATGKTQKLYYFGFGPGYYSNMNSRSAGVDFASGISWSLDPRFDLAATASLGFSMEHRDVRFFSPQLKGKYMFSEDPFSWYAGGGFGFGSSHAHNGESTNGFAVSAALGYRAYRQSNLQLSFEFEHQMILKESTVGTPILTSLKVGIHF